jgi:hypothetical protein
LLRLNSLICIGKKQNICPLLGENSEGGPRVRDHSDNNIVSQVDFLMNNYAQTIKRLFGLHPYCQTNAAKKG